MRQQSGILVVILLIALLQGCGVQPGRKLVTYNTTTTDLPKPVTAGADGTYALYPDDGITPIEKIQAKRGEKLGFRRDPDGRVVAFAGDREYSLNAVLALDYYWKFVGNAAGQK